MIPVLLMIGLHSFGAEIDMDKDKSQKNIDLIIQGMTPETKQLYIEYAEFLIQDGYDHNPNKILVQLIDEANLSLKKKNNKVPLKSDHELKVKYAMQIVDRLNSITKEAYVNYFIEGNCLNDDYIFDCLIIDCIEKKKTDLIEKVLLISAPMNLLNKSTPQALVFYGEKSYIEYLFRAYYKTENKDVKKKLGTLICDAFPLQEKSTEEEWASAAWAWYRKNKSVLVVNNADTNTNLPPNVSKERLALFRIDKKN